jgi:hypothetical protein
MNNVNVPQEWPKSKKIKVLIVSFVLLTAFLLFSI